MRNLKASQKRLKKKSVKRSRKIVAKSNTLRATTKIGRKKKVKVITFNAPIHGRRLYCGGLDYLPSEEYERFGTRRECLDIGIGVGHAIEYNYLRELLLKEGYQIPERKRLNSY